HLREVDRDPVVAVGLVEQELDRERLRQCCRQLDPEAARAAEFQQLATAQLDYLGVAAHELELAGREAPHPLVGPVGGDPHRVTRHEVVVAPDAGAGGISGLGGGFLALHRVAAGVGDHVPIAVADLDLLAIALRLFHTAAVAQRAVDRLVDGLVDLALDPVLDPVSGTTNHSTYLCRQHARQQHPDGEGGDCKTDLHLWLRNGGAGISPRHARKNRAPRPPVDRGASVQQPLNQAVASATFSATSLTALRVAAFALAAPRLVALATLRAAVVVAFRAFAAPRFAALPAFEAALLAALRTFLAVFAADFLTLAAVLEVDFLAAFFA